MSLRITGGGLRGRTVASPDDMSTRPTTDMWRQTIFSALDHLIDLQGACGADLFAGTGMLGIEALSRGATEFVFVESQRKRTRAITASLAELGLTARSSVVEGTVLEWIPSAARVFDLVLADPPYALHQANQLRDAIAANGILVPGGLLVIEHAPAEYLLDVDNWQRVWGKEKGDTSVDILQWQPPAS